LFDRKTDGLAQQEKAYDSDSRTSEAVTKNFADLFDTQPELLEGLQDPQLDEIIEGLLV